MIRSRTVRTGTDLWDRTYAAGTVVDFTPYERFQRYLEANGKRLTRERSVIVNLVFAQAQPFTADQLCQKLQDQEEPIRISRSTVYRARLI